MSLKSQANEDSLNSAPIYGANALKMDHDLDKESVPAERNNADMGTQDNKLDTGTKNNKLNEISLDSLAYIENAEQNNQEENQQQTDIAQSVNQGEKEETTPQLFTEEENADAPQKEVDFQKRSESLINEHEEEDFEIPAFLRKQKN